MLSADINYLAVLVGGIISMVVGFLWYSPMLFAKPWLAAIGKKEEDLAKGNMGMTYGTAFILALLMSYVLSHFVDYAGAATMVTGAQVGLWAWLGFTATTLGVQYLFEHRPSNLYLINAGYHLVEMVIIGAVLAIWV